VILWLPGRFPGLNDLLGAKSSQKGNWNAYADLKRRHYGQIKLLCQAKRVEPVGPGYFTFLFIESDRRRDPDNIAAGGIKLIFDSLVGADVMKGDSWAHVLGFVAYWQVGARPGCLVNFTPDGLVEKGAMLLKLEREIGKDAHKEDR